MTIEKSTKPSVKAPKAVPGQGKVAVAPAGVGAAVDVASASPQPIVTTGPLSLNGVCYLPDSFSQQEIEAAAVTRSKSVAEPVKGDTDQYLVPEDVCAVALICSTHRKLAVTEMSSLELNSSTGKYSVGGNNGYWLPWTPVDQRKDIIETTLNELIRKLVDMSTCEYYSNIFVTQPNHQQLYFAVKFRNLIFCAHDRVQVPKSGRYINRYFHRVEISPVTSAKSSSPSNEQCICLAWTQPNSNQKYCPLFWLSYNDLCEPQVVSSMAGPEPKMIAEQYLEDLEVSRTSVPNGSRGSRGQSSRPGEQTSQTKVVPRKWTNAERFGTDFATDDMTSSFLPPSGSKHQLMICTSLNRSDVLSLYNEFVLHCYPSIAMGQFSLGRFLAEKLAVNGMSSSGNDVAAGAAKVAKYFRYVCAY